MQQPEHFTLKQIAGSIRKTIESRYARTYWVTAEMHKLNQTRKGHCYPELVQKEGDEIVVEMRGTIWKNAFDQIQRQFMNTVKEPLRDGMELLFQVRIVYHPIYNIGLEIINIDPTYTLGALHKERQATLERLNKEGILNANQLLALPMVPKRLAVISQGDSKGYSDFKLLLDGHPNGYRFDCMLFEATLQGDAAISSIQQQLKRIETVKHHFDAVVIVRGGGGEIGMHCYNNYELARAIATFPLPIFTGIGHSTNMTVCEMVAFNNGITPSDLAYFLLRIFEELDEPLNQFKLRLPLIVNRYLQGTKHAFDYSTNCFVTGTWQQMKAHNQQLQTIRTSFKHTSTSALANFQHVLELDQQSLKNGTQQLISGNQGRLQNNAVTLRIHGINQTNVHLRGLDSHVKQLERSTTLLLQSQKNNLFQAEKQMHLMDPIHVLKRGYAIVTDENGVISTNVPKKGGKIHVRTSGVEFDAEAL